MGLVEDLEEASRQLPLQVREVLPGDLELVVSGSTWSLTILCPMQLRTPSAVFEWDSQGLADAVWELIGLNLEAIEAVRGNPLFKFEGGYVIAVRADTDFDPWVLRVPGLILVGTMPRE